MSIKHMLDQELLCMQVMRSYRVLLAPLRYGAGLKGKIVDAWAHGLPVVTTPIGAEGMHADEVWSRANSRLGHIAWAHGLPVVHACRRREHAC